MRCRRAVVVVLVAAVLAGCGAAGGSKGDAGTKAPGPGTNPGRTATTSVSPSTAPPAAGAAASGSPAPDAAAAPSAPPQAQRPTAAATEPATPPAAAASGDDAGLPFRASVTPRCVERGGALAVEVVTRAHASIAAAAAFADDDAHGAFTVGAADPRGRWAWRAIVPADAPLGDGEVQLSAQDRSPGPTEHEAGTTGEQAEAVIPFEVRRSC